MWAGQIFHVHSFPRPKVVHVHIFLGEGIPALNRAQGAGAPELLQVVLDEVTGREENHGNLSTYSFERSTTPRIKPSRLMVGKTILFRWLSFIFGGVFLTNLKIEVWWSSTTHTFCIEVVNQKPFMVGLLSCGELIFFRENWGIPQFGTMKNLPGSICYQVFGCWSLRRWTCPKWFGGTMGHAGS